MVLVILDFNLNFTKSASKKKRRPYTAIQGRVKHYQPNGTGRDIYVFNNHGGLTMGNKCIKKHAFEKYTDCLRKPNKANKVTLGRRSNLEEEICRTDPGLLKTTYQKHIIKVID